MAGRGEENLSGVNVVILFDGITNYIILSPIYIGTQKTVSFYTLVEPIEKKF